MKYQIQVCVKNVCLASIMFMVSLLTGCVSESGLAKASIESTHLEVSSEVAILIATARIECDHDISREHASARDGGDSWIVEFSWKKEFEHLKGGGSAVEIDKHTGKVTKVYIGK